MIYVALELGPKVKLSPFSPLDPDLQVIDIMHGTGSINLINIYNQSREHGRTIHCFSEDLLQNPKTILLGDFNMHHPRWEPESNGSHESDLFVEWLDGLNMELINNPGQGTFFRSHMMKPTVIDLTFASTSITNQIVDWQTL